MNKFGHQLYPPWNLIDKDYKVDYNIFCQHARYFILTEIKKAREVSLGSTMIRYTGRWRTRTS